MYFSMHNHSMYSCLDGYGTPKECLDRAKEAGLAGYAITDHESQCAWPYFDEIKKNYDLKMVYGVELYECSDINIKDADNRYWHLLAIARNEQGRKALNWIVSKSKDGFYFRQRVDLNTFRECFKKFPSDSIIISTACLASHLAKEEDCSECVKIIEKYKSVFPLFYLEMQSHDTEDQKAYNEKILSLSMGTHTPYVITTDSHYNKPEDEKYQQMLVRIAKDKDTIGEIYKDCYIQTEEQIHSIMDSQIGSDSVTTGLEETMKILDMIDTVDMPWTTPKLPRFPVPEGETELSYIKKLINIGYVKRGITKKSKEEQEKYKERIRYELSVIDKMDFTGYFLIVHEYIQWSKANDIAVGIGRGSGAGCIVNYLLFITDVDPLKYGLIFERFLNPERVSMPDIDSDFDKKELVIKHMEDTYGVDYVAQVMNFIYITPLVAIDIVSAQLGIPFKDKKNVSKAFIYKTWEECEEKLSFEITDAYNVNPLYMQVFDYAKHLSGRVKNIGIHASGVVIGQTSLYDYMGTVLGKGKETVICLDKKKSEPMGLIKFDILGLANLTMIKEAQKDLHMDDWEMNTNNPSFINDPQSFSLICSGNTDAVFQMESAGMKNLIKFVQPKTIEDLSLVIALYRPDAMKSLETYKDNKLHPESMVYWCDEVKPILEPTCGALVYQEQLMDIVRVLGGRTYGGADKFRKGIGKKDINLVREESEKLETEIVNNGYDYELAHKVSTLLSSMGSYLFNSSHAICYAILGLQTAYLKAHYPIEFYKCLFNFVKDDRSSLGKYIHDAQEAGIKVLPPNINQSQGAFSVHGDSILFGLVSISGLGDKACEQILDERNANGNFKSMTDILERCKFLTVSQVVSLIKSGAITSNKLIILLGYANYIKPYREYKPLKQISGSIKTNYEKYGVDLSTAPNKAIGLEMINVKRREEFNKQTKIKQDEFIEGFKEKYMQDEFMWEFETLSMFLSDNPLSSACDKVPPWEDVEDGQIGVIVGVIIKVDTKKSKKGNRYGFITAYTSYQNCIECVCWNKVFINKKDHINKGEPVVMLCRKDGDQIILEDIKEYNTWVKENIDIDK